MARAPTRTVVGPEPEGGPSNPFDFDLDNALKLLEKAEAGVCESFLEALSKRFPTDDRGELCVIDLRRDGNEREPEPEHREQPPAVELHPRRLLQHAQQLGSQR